MIAFAAAVKVGGAGGVTGMRVASGFSNRWRNRWRPLNTLALQVQEGLGRDPHAAGIFCY